MLTHSLLVNYRDLPALVNYRGCAFRGNLRNLEKIYIKMKKCRIYLYKFHRLPPLFLKHFCTSSGETENVESVVSFIIQKGPVIRATFFFNLSRNIVALQVETHCCAYSHVCDQLVSQQKTAEWQVCGILHVQSCVIEKGSFFHVIWRFDELSLSPSFSF